MRFRSDSIPAHSRLRVRPSLLLCALGRHKPVKSFLFEGGRVTREPLPPQRVRLAWCARCRAAVKP